MSHPESRSSRTELALTVIAFGFVAWLFACIVNADRLKAMDDAYITYGYARNLAEGHGLRYNATDAEPTSGASSLVHVALSALGISAGLDPLAFTRALGIAGLLALALVFGLLGSRIARAPPSSGALAGIAVVLLWGLMPETAVHLGSGMDTLLHTTIHGLVFAWTAWVAVDDGDSRRRALSGPQAALGAIVLGALALSRPEGALLALLYLAALVMIRRSERGLLGAALSLAPVAAPFALIVAGTLAWRWWYFGDVAGNAYYVKVANRLFGSRGEWLPGASTTLRFAAIRLAPCAILLFALASVVRVPSEAVRRAGWLLLPPLAIALLYARAIHEMAAGFRYEYATYAPIACALVVALCVLRRRAPGSFATLLVTFAVAVPLLASSTSPRIGTWLAHPRSSATLWWPGQPPGSALAKLGLDLAETGLGQQATILLSGAGQVPYFSRFRAVDWIGLNHDRLSGREAMTIEEMWRYLDSLGPDLVFSILPPAAPGSRGPLDDPNFSSELVQRTLDGRGSALFAHWDRERLAESFWREMTWLRDRCEFAASYELGDAWGGDWWVLVYVRRDSPHRAKLLETLSNSRRADENPDLGAVFPYDPRALGRT